MLALGDFATTAVERVHVHSAIPLRGQVVSRLLALKGLWRYTQGAPALARISRPWCRMFSAAFTLALAWWLQFVHRKTDWLGRLPAATWPHAEQRWLV